MSSADRPGSFRRRPLVPHPQLQDARPVMAARGWVPPSFLAYTRPIARKLPMSHWTARRLARVSRKTYHAGSRSGCSSWSSSLNRGRLEVAPMSSVRRRRLTKDEQLSPPRQRRWSAVLSTVGSLTTVKELKMTDMPEIVSAGKWQQDRDELLKAEKEATRALDALAARRRRLPMVEFDNSRYVFGTSAGPKTLLDGGVGWATVSSMPLAQIGAYKARMGWTMPFVSSHGATFADDCGGGGGFMLSVFLRDGEHVYRTYCRSE